MVEWIHSPSEPLSRNRHFHTFDNPQGREALRISKRLKALEQELIGAIEQPVKARRKSDDEVVLEWENEKIHGRRQTVLKRAELELLRQLPGMKDRVVPDE